MRFAWMSEVEAEDLPAPFDRLAEEIGLTETLTVMEMFEGTQVYFPSVKTAFASARNRVIQRRYTGYNLHELAVEFNLTDRMIRYIVNDDPRQIELFPEAEKGRDSTRPPGSL